jgi:riboflavin kinase/FMN adenylyltransferase
MGFPTANIGADPLKILPPGIFAVRCRVGGEAFTGVANSGSRPTVNTLDGRMLLEVHILDFSRQIYGETVEVEFLSRLRGEKRFPSKESLARAIALDIARARSVFRGPAAAGLR